MQVVLGWLVGMALAGGPSTPEDAVEATRAWARPAQAEGIGWEPRAVQWGGGTLVRMDRTLHGLVVHGGEVIAAVGPTGEVRRTRGQRARLHAPIPRPTLDGQAALQVAREVGARLGQGELWSPRITLGWWVEPETREPTLSWVAELSTVRPLSTWRTFIDAHRGEVLATERTSSPARGWGYAQNPVVSEAEELPLFGLDPESGVLQGEYSFVRSCDSAHVPGNLIGVACDALAHQALADSQGDFLYALAPEQLDDPAAEVQVYYHVDRVAAFLEQRYGFRLPHPIQGITNFELANAFYGDFDGDGLPDLSFGQDPRTGVDFAYDGDVVYHEFGHAVTARVANLPWVAADSWGMDWVGPSLNEGYADVLAIVLTGDPRVGEYAGSAFGVSAIREVSSPRRCPDDLPGESHADGELLGALAWRLLGALGPERTHDLFFGALPFWGRDVTWSRAGQTLIDSADDLQAAGRLSAAERDQVVEAIHEMNLVDCPRYRLLTSGRSVWLFAANLGLQGDLMRIPAGLQLAIDVPADASSLELRIREASGSESMGWTAFLRSGAHVEHDVLALDGLGLAVAAAKVYDAMHDGKGTEVLNLSLDSDPPLVPGERLYLALSSRNTGSIEPFDIHYAMFEVQADLRTAPGSDAPLRFEGGGGCATATGGAGAAGALSLWALGLALRRRRGSEVRSGR